METVEIACIFTIVVGVIYMFIAATGHLNATIIGSSVIVMIWTLAFVLLQLPCGVAPDCMYCEFRDGECHSSSGVALYYAATITGLAALALHIIHPLLYIVLCAFKVPQTEATAVQTAIEDNSTAIIDTDIEEPGSFL